MNCSLSKKDILGEQYSNTSLAVLMGFPFNLEYECLLFNSKSATIWQALAEPMPLISCNSLREQAESLSKPYLEIRRLDISMTFSSLVPVFKIIAKSSASDKTEGPCFSSRSLGLFSKDISFMRIYK